jgi:hypothetical protein
VALDEISLTLLPLYLREKKLLNMKLAATQLTLTVMECPEMKRVVQPVGCQIEIREKLPFL